MSMMVLGATVSTYTFKQTSIFNDNLRVRGRELHTDCDRDGVAPVISDAFSDIQQLRAYLKLINAITEVS